MDREVECKLTELLGSQDYPQWHQSSSRRQSHGVPQRSILRTIPFNIFTKHPINDGKECNFIKFSDNTKLGVVDTSGCCAAMQKDANRLEKGANRSLMQFNK